MWRQFQHVSVHKEESTVILLEEVKIRLSSKLDWRERTLAEVHSRERKDAIGEPSVLWCQLRLLYKPWFLTQPMISNIQGRTNRIKNGGWPSYLLKQECRYLARTLGLPSELSDSTTTTALRSGLNLSVNSSDENEKKSFWQENKQEMKRNQRACNLLI